MTDVHEAERVGRGDVKVPPLDKYVVWVLDTDGSELTWWYDDQFETLKDAKESAEDNIRHTRICHNTDQPSTASAVVEAAVKWRQAWDFRAVNVTEHEGLQAMRALEAAIDAHLAAKGDKNANDDSQR